MTDAIEQLKPTIAALSHDERLSLADWIYESADGPDDPDLLEELERRRIAFENGSSPSRPARDVIRDLRARYARLVWKSASKPNSSLRTTPANMSFSDPAAGHGSSKR